ncbi:MAG: MBL fold metallo-hydrolase [Gemmatimonadota bacterium]
MRTLVPVLVLVAAACQEAPAPARDQPRPPGSDFQGPAFEFEQVLPDIYHVRGTGNLSIGSNGAVIVNDDDVLLVDSHISPAAAVALLDELKTITDKPVRYVVNTHFHFDHAHGNQIYPPEIQVIGHEFTRDMLENGGSLGRSYQQFVMTLPDQISALEAQLPSAAQEERPELEARLAYLRTYWEGQQGLEPTGPNTTLSQRMTLFRGGREIQLLFFGRGHTGGDVVVYLPAERVLVSGDLLTGGLPFMGDGYTDEWDDTLEHLKALDFEWVLPGHGTPFQGKESIDWLQAYLRDLQSRAAALHARGLSFEEAAGQIDMRDHAEHYASITSAGVAPIAVQRIFELLDQAGR